ncbi:beta-ketoacyl synthase chain length factor [Permianibacter aggregans]|uniref:Beta-ketoacyl synthase-like protein n=1 Tax=Permianibacter aggregans TaxID=1510150 RepID=A0A4R6UG39_9GAMM|nr:beta-ketoacyl synthase chain length factor [Permianibacter aggregans]QGX40301.1 3-oxoacyl-ACP synthase [Permianibacter aggregans]TDQ44219.1 beta-ketoacyl synthase-like protein [Permianibacter aggregans]
MLNFAIADWQAWAPFAEDHASWQRWAAGETLPPISDKPALSWVNPMLRRRLSFLSRLMLQVAKPLAERQAIDAWVFASRHGELQTTVQLLVDIAKNEPLSPMAFSLSVHNTGAGLFSIASGTQAPMNAIAAGRDTFVMALTDAVARVNSHRAERVAVVYAEELLPERYADYQQGEAPALALGVVVDRSAAQWQLNREAGEATEGSPAEVMLKVLLGADREQHFPAEQGIWRLSRVGT